jgi:aryl-alcohol dehydrogenase-like predicted oxidoreductase
MAKLDLLYAHLDDMTVPLEDVVGGMAALVADGMVGLLGASNHWAWRIERARALAAAAGLPGYEVLQYHHTYLRRRTDLPGHRAVDGEPGVANGDLLSYVRATPEVPLVAYSALLGGGYTRDDKPLESDLEHPGTPVRLDALREVVKDTGATANQVVLAWLIGGDVPMIPLISASSVAQIEESIAAVDLELTAEQRARLDAAC